jgi:hypothetical protein
MITVTDTSKPPDLSPSLSLMNLTMSLSVSHMETVSLTLPSPSKHVNQQ